MNEGDLIKKIHGDSDVGKTGMIIEVVNSSVGYTFFRVLVNESSGEIKTWWKDQVKEIKSSEGVKRVK